MNRNMEKSGTSFGAFWIFILFSLLAILIMFASLVPGLIVLGICIIGAYVSLVSTTVFSRRYNKGRKELGVRRNASNGLLTFLTWFLLSLISIPLLGIPLVLALIVAQTEGTKNY